MTEERLKAILEEKSTQIFSDADDMIKIGATFARGATKKVLVIQNKGFVLKCDRYPSRAASYCQAEFENYKSAVKEGIEKILLPTTEFCVCHDGIVFYKQSIYKCNADLDASKAKIVEEKIQEFDVCSRRERKIERITNLFYSSSNLYSSGDWVARAIQYYGTNFMKKVAAWTMEYEVNDLHAGNLGYIGNYRPIILDYSGYRG